MSKPKKKFKDTKVGAFLGKVAPSIIGTMGDVLPDAGVLGIVKNLIEKEDPKPEETAPAEPEATENNIEPVENNNDNEDKNEAPKQDEPAQEPAAE